MTTLKNLVHKGVKVDLGLPLELWDEPSAEVSDMKKQVGLLIVFMAQKGLFGTEERVNNDKYKPSSES